MVRASPFLLAIAISNAVTSWLDLFSPEITSANEESTQTPWSVAGNLTYLRYEFSAAPGAGRSWTFTVRIAGVPTAAVVTVADLATIGTWTGSVPIAVGDLVSVQVDPVGAPAGSLLHVTTEFNSSDPRTSGYGNGGIQTNAIDRFWGSFSGSMRNASIGVPAECQDVVPLEGTIESLHGMTVSAPFAKSTFEFSLWLNGVKQDGAAGTVDTRVTVNGGVAQATGFRNFVLPVVPGDVVFTRITRTVAAFNPDGATSSIRFRANAAGQSVFAGNYQNPIGTPVYNPMLTTEDFFAWGADTPTSRSIAGVTPFTLRNGWLQLSTAPGLGQTRRVGFRLNGVDTAIFVDLADLATQGSVVGSVAIVADDRTQAFATRSAAPAASFVSFAMIQAIAVAAVASRRCRCRCRRA